MMPPTYQLLMPAVLAGSAGLIATRNPRRYPALFAWACLTAFFVGAVWGSGAYPSWVLIAAAAILPFQVRECLNDSSRISVSWKVFSAVLAASAASSIALGLGTHPSSPWTVARSYYQLDAMCVMGWATIYRLRHPILESRRDKAYRIGMTLWLLVKAPASTFVAGGLGATLWPVVSRDAVEQRCYWALMACVSGMALAMWIKMPGRKRAAKKPDGKVVCGLIEMERAA